MPNALVRAAAEGMPSINDQERGLEEQFVWLLDRLTPEQLKEALQELEVLVQAEKSRKREIHS